MERSADFFRDEVRNGFYIPTAIKQGWAEELDVLDAIDHICEKHGIRYFADWGTLLGAVRHGGFVPWDDDLDIAMLRPDYKRFREVADAELPEGFVIHDFERKEDHWLFLARVVNNEKMCFTEEYLDAHNNFPWLAGVDIFLKDYLYKDEEKEKERDKKIWKLLAIADGITDGTLSPEAASVRLDEIKEQYHVKLPERSKKREVSVALYKLAEGLMSGTGYGEAEKVGQIYPWVLKNGFGAAEPKERYEKSIRLPFEDTTIPVPAAYVDSLSSRYGNYYEIKKVWKGHDYPFFEGQKKEMEEISGESFPHFVYDDKMKERAIADEGNSLKNTCKECLAALNELLDNAEESLAECDHNGFARTMADCQQLAADLGTLIEKTKGENAQGTMRIIEALQVYCDVLWEECRKLDAEPQAVCMSGIRDALTKVSDGIKENVTGRSEVLFLPVGSKEWEGMERYYENELNAGNTDIYIVPLPLMKKNFFGKIKMSDDGAAELDCMSCYPDSLPLTDWKSYDIALHCPDKVYIQNPYDGENPCLTVPPLFYAKNLQRYTKKLVYVPIAKTAEFTAEDRNDRYNMRHYVTAPGVVYSDEVLVQSQNMKEQYVEVLTGFAGTETRSLWDNKIKVSGLSEHEEKKRTVKEVLFCIGANEMAEKGEAFVLRLTDKLRIFYDAGASVHPSIYFYPNDSSQWIAVDADRAKRVFEMINAGAREKKCSIVSIEPIDADSAVKNYDAYYGSPSPLMPAFVAQGKPVMLADYGLETDVG